MLEPGGTHSLGTGEAEPPHPHPSGDARVQVTGDRGRHSRSHLGDGGGARWRRQSPADGDARRRLAHMDMGT